MKGLANTVTGANLSLSAASTTISTFFVHFDEKTSYWQMLHCQVMTSLFIAISNGLFHHIVYMYKSSSKQILVFCRFTFSYLFTHFSFIMLVSIWLSRQQDKNHVNSHTFSQLMIMIEPFSLECPR